MPVLLDPEEAETRALHTLVDFTGKDVLEIGCGDGRMTWRFADDARSVLALDPVAQSIAEAQAVAAAQSRSNVIFQVADITTAMLPHATYDVAVFSWSLC
jgi:ubiquinone/menaquinone biosynthesis C-methylase UbiE